MSSATTHTHKKKKRKKTNNFLATILIIFNITGLKMCYIITGVYSFELLTIYKQP